MLSFKEEVSFLLKIACISCSCLNFFGGGGGSHEVFPYLLGLLRNTLFILLDCIWMTFGLISRAHSCPI